jgi:hypothetical protein
MTERQAASEMTYRWVIRDDEGAWVETHACETREQAIALFCHPALRWDGFEATGWTVTQEPLTKPLGVASVANLEVPYDPFA